MKQSDIPGEQNLDTAADTPLQAAQPEKGPVNGFAASAGRSALGIFPAPAPAPASVVSSNRDVVSGTGGDYESELETAAGPAAFMNDLAA